MPEPGSDLWSSTYLRLSRRSNIGVHSRFLFEPSKYPDAKTGRRLFNEHFGDEESRDNRDICSFAFEPNPVHVTRHRELAEVRTGIFDPCVPVLTPPVNQGLQ